MSEQTQHTGIPTPNPIFGNLQTTIFEKMSRLASMHGSINLGQGFPSDQLEGPREMKEQAIRSLNEESNQYAPMMGVPELRRVLAAHAWETCKLRIDPVDGVLVTVGATEALAAIFLAFVNNGDEVIVFSPVYDSYCPMIRRAGGVVVTVALRPPSWAFQVDDLARAIGPRTRMIVLNSPHNPTGKVFSVDELTAVASLIANKPIIAVCDEVYQHLVFPGSSHATLAAIHDVSDQCIRIGSAGKTFSFTGFKVGWMSSTNTNLIVSCAKAHQFLTFAVNPALQRAVEYGLLHCKSFVSNLGKVLCNKRQKLERRLSEIGFLVLPANGTYFLVADFSSLRKCDEESDLDFCARLTEEAGVTPIPVSAFYENQDQAPRNLVRFVVCKTDDMLEAACDRLEQYLSLKA